VLALAAALVILIIAILCLPIFFAPHTVARADVILHFSFDPRMRGDHYAAQLYRQGMAPAIVCAGSQASWEVYPADSSRQHLINLGVPAEAVSVLHLPIVDCAGELAPILIEALKARGVRSVLIVADPTATRFGSWRFVQRLAEAGISASITFAEQDRTEMLDGWWHSHWKAQRVVGAVMNSTLDLLYAPCR
jgi:uncharacterized SAM-binding protein YcdF (DUF218 family)